jgi:uncharacterized protein (TIGR02145 family)
MKVTKKFSGGRLAALAAAFAVIVLCACEEPPQDCGGKMLGEMEFCKKDPISGKDSVYLLCGGKTKYEPASQACVGGKLVGAVTVVFHPNGATGGTVPEPRVATDDGNGTQKTVVLAPKGNLTYEGMQFVGWHTNQTNQISTGTIYVEGAKYSTDKAAGSTVTLYAMWVKALTVTFFRNGDDATGDLPSPRPILYHKPLSSSKFDYWIEMPTQGNLRRDGYVFSGWNEDPNPDPSKKDRHFEPGRLTTVPADAGPDVKLHAEWNRLLIVTFYPNDATSGTAPKPDTAEYDALAAKPGFYITLPQQGDLLRKGYKFVGWNKFPNGTGEDYAAGTLREVPDNAGSGLKLYAKWIKLYTVTYDANGVDVAEKTFEVPSGDTVTLPEPAFTRPGYSAVGWTINPRGTGTVYKKGNNYRVTEDVTFYAKWIREFTVNFAANDGTDKVVTTIKMDSGTYITPLPSQTALVRNGYSVDGWNTEDDGTGTNLKVTDSYQVLRNATLYARWIRKFTVTLKANGGTGTVPTVAPTDSGTSIKLPNPTNLTLNGFNFSGWGTDSADGMGTEYTVTASYRVLRDDTLFAKWKENSYTLTTNASPANGGSVSRNIAGTSYSPGTKITVTAKAEGVYVFTGWSGASTSQDASVEVLMDGNKTLTAVFAKTVVIGGKRWMAENLNYQTSNLSWCYDNSTYNCDKYGRLYDWNTAKTACPKGWHLPTLNEWTGLVTAAGGIKVAGKKLKAKSGWSNSGNGTDDFGFSALPGGSYDQLGFAGVGLWGFWWTATAKGANEALAGGIVHNRDDTDMGGSGAYGDLLSGFSVRCVSD